MLAGTTGGGHTAAKTSHAHAAAQAQATQAVQDAVSHMAAEHAARVVHHIGATHQHGHNPAPQGYHPDHHGGYAPGLRAFIEHQSQPINALSVPLSKAIHAAMWDPSNYAPNPGYSLVQGGPGQMPYQMPDANTQWQQQMQGPQQGPNYAGNNSIAPNGQDNGGIMSLIQSLFGG